MGIHSLPGATPLTLWTNSIFKLTRNLASTLDTCVLTSDDQLVCIVYVIVQVYSGVSVRAFDEA